MNDHAHSNNGRASMKHPSLRWFFVSLLTGAAAALTFCVVAYLPTDWGSASLLVGLVTFALMLAHNPLYWQRRLVISILSLWAAVNALPLIDFQFDLESRGFLRILGESASPSFHLAVVVLAAMLLLYDYARTRDAFEKLPSVEKAASQHEFQHSLDKLTEDERARVVYSIGDESPGLISVMPVRSKDLSGAATERLLRHQFGTNKAVALAKQRNVLVAILVGGLTVPAIALTSVWIVSAAPRSSERELQTVSVFLDSEFGLIDTFSLQYDTDRRHSITSGLGNAQLTNIPKNDRVVRFSRIECPAYIPEKQRHGFPSPWEYPIGEDQQVRIRMVRRSDLNEPPDLGIRPTKADTFPLMRELAHRKHWTEAELRAQMTRQPLVPKEDVNFLYRNDTGYEFLLVLFDCRTCFNEDGNPVITSPAVAGLADGEVLDLGTTGKLSKLVRPSDPGKPEWNSLTTADLQCFATPSGWFAFFVYYQNRFTGEWQLFPLTIYDIFQSHETKMVIAHTEGRQFDAQFAPLAE